MKSRKKLIDTVENYLRSATPDMVDKIERILDDNGASSDDSDPDEGMYVTMTNMDIQNAIWEIEDILIDSAEDEVKQIDKFYESLTHKRNLSIYEEGWLEGYEAAMDRYDINRR